MAGGHEIKWTLKSKHLRELKSERQAVAEGERRPIQAGRGLNERERRLASRGRRVSECGRQPCDDRRRVNERCKRLSEQRIGFELRRR